MGKRLEFQEFQGHHPVGSPGHTREAREARDRQQVTSPASVLGLRWALGLTARARARDARSWELWGLPLSNATLNSRG